MIKYVGWFLLWSVGFSFLFYDLPQGAYKYFFDETLIYSGIAVTGLKLVCFLLAALGTGYSFAETVNRSLDAKEAKFLAGALIAAVTIIFFFQHLLAMRIYEDINGNAVLVTAMEKYVRKPHDPTMGFLTFYAFYFLFHYWMIRWLFVQGALLRLRYLKYKLTRKET